MYELNSSDQSYGVENFAFLQEWQKAAVAFLARYRGATLALYEVHLKAYFAWCEQVARINPLDAERAHLEMYISHYLTSHKASSTCSAMTPIKGYYKFAHMDGRIQNNPAAYVRLPKAIHSVKPNLEIHEIRQILAAAREVSPRHWCLTQMLCVMGMRVSEACSITVEQALNIEQGMHVLNYVGKGDVATKKAIPYQSLEAFKAQIGDRTSGYLLLNLRGGKLTRHAGWTLIDTVGRRAGRKINPHYLRALGASTLDSLDSMQEFLSHVDPNTTKRHYDLRSKTVASQSVHMVGARLAV